jgi:hypothetical protein
MARTAVEGNSNKRTPPPDIQQQQLAAVGATTRIGLHRLSKAAR